MTGRPVTDRPDPVIPESAGWSWPDIPVRDYLDERRRTRVEIGLLLRKEDALVKITTATVWSTFDAGTAELAVVEAELAALKPAPHAFGGGVNEAEPAWIDEYLSSGSL